MAFEASETGAMSGGKAKAVERAEISQRAGGLKVERHLTRPGENALETVNYVKRDSVISNPDGSVVFEARGVDVPEGWSQLATDIAVSKYFRKAGLHGDPKKGERSVRELVYRVAHTIREAGEEFGGYFADEEAAETFEQELAHLLVHQKAAFNSPVWFNCGLYHHYGIEGSGGNWAWDPATDAITMTENAYVRPQCSACFIQSVEDEIGRAHV